MKQTPPWWRSTVMKGKGEGSKLCEDKERVQKGQLLTYSITEPWEKSRGRKTMSEEAAVNTNTLFFAVCKKWCRIVRNAVRKQCCLTGWLEKEQPGLPSGRSVRTTFDLQQTPFQQTSGSKGKCRKQKKKVKATAAFSWNNEAVKCKVWKRQGEKERRERKKEKDVFPYRKERFLAARLALSPHGPQ